MTAGVVEQRIKIDKDEGEKDETRGKGRKGCGP